MTARDWQLDASVDVTPVAVMAAIIRVMVVIVSIILPLDLRWLALPRPEHQEEDYNAKYEPLK